MKKSNPNQKTLFQSWGKQTTTSQQSVPTRQGRQNNIGFDPLEIIDLGDDNEDDGLIAAAMEMESTVHGENAPSETLVSASPIEIEYLPGFDMDTGNVWIYPTNYPVRDYQFKIVEKSLMLNTLVTLPTGLGKTFIAAVLMYNYYRWYPQGKVIFMAPTKPLVAQQIEACYKIMGIPESDTTEMTGNGIL